MINLNVRVILFFFIFILKIFHENSKNFFENLVEKYKKLRNIKHLFPHKFVLLYIRLTQLLLYLLIIMQPS